VLLWTLAADRRLPRRLADRIDRDPAQFGISDVCFWEIAIKLATGRLRAPADLPEVVADLGFQQVSITPKQAWSVRDLPLHHRDPFDRLLVVQAQDLDCQS
jgi:PIN domain nuclease of toxin-antitoxin system